MMDNTYLCRGKRLDNGEWVTGFYTEIHHNNDISHIHHVILVPPIYEHPVHGTANGVDPTTVGKCSGIPAAKSYRGDGPEDKLVFEGDVIKLVTADGEEITVICKFGTVRRQIFENDVEITGFYFERSNDGRKTFPIVCNYLGKHDSEIWEIIGTIHDIH